MIDLKTGEIQEHKPEFFITQKTNVNLDPNGTCNNFLYFLDTIMDGNQEMDLRGVRRSTFIDRSEKRLPV